MQRVCIPWICMLVYGDPRQIEAVTEKAGRIRAGLVAAAFDPPGIARHARLASLLVEAGELAQRLLDERLGREGTERPGEVGERVGRLCFSLTEALLHSLTQGFQHEALATGQVQRDLDALLSLDLPAAIEVRVPEGYAFYGLYPECYLAAGTLFRAELPTNAGAPVPVHVVGIRSIGTSLAAAVAAALAAGPVRPVVPADRRPPEHPPVSRGPGGSQRPAPPTAPSGQQAARRGEPTSPATARTRPATSPAARTEPATSPPARPGSNSSRSVRRAIPSIAASTSPPRQPPASSPRPAPATPSSTKGPASPAARSAASRTGSKAAASPAKRSLSSPATAIPSAPKPANATADAGSAPAA